MIAAYRCDTSPCKRYTTHPDRACAWCRNGFAKAGFGERLAARRADRKTTRAVRRGEIPVRTDNTPVGDDGIAWTLRWFYRGRLSRLDAPAEIDYFTHGTVAAERWFRGGVRHREGDLPAEIEWGPDSPRNERWHVHGKRHRDGAPAAIIYFGGSAGRQEWWYFQDKAHRVDGPASAFIDGGGKVYGETWIFLDQEVSGARGIGRKLLHLPDTIAREHLEASSYRLLLDEGIEQKKVVGALLSGIYSHEGIRALAEGTPVEWVHAFEQGVAS